MNHLDELERAISDRQHRYRHQAYRDHLARHTLRRHFGFRLLHSGGTASARPST